MRNTRTLRCRLGFVRALPILALAACWAFELDAQAGRYVQSPTIKGERRSWAANPNPDAPQPGALYVYGGPGSVLGKFQTTLAPSSPSDPQGWTGFDHSSAGDFSQFFKLIGDTDACSDNFSGVAGFYDTGSTNPSWTYGVPGGYVVPYALALPIHNEIRSPPIPWDLAGPADDGVGYVGGRLKFRIWKHLPVETGMAYYWTIRVGSGGVWEPWVNQGLVEYGNDLGVWIDESHDFGHLIDLECCPNPEIQIALGVIDMSATLGIVGSPALLSPIFDDVSVEKYIVGGPMISAHHIDLFQDSFAQSGATASQLGTVGQRNTHDVRVDASRDVDPTIVNEAQDELHVHIVSRILGSGITDPSTQIQLHYSLNMNPLFEPAIRGNAPITGAGSGLKGWNQSEGSVATLGIAMDSGGSPIADTYAFDLPDEDFMYPGDILEYYIEAWDDNGNTTTLPADLTGYDNPSLDYDPAFSMHALPTLTSVSGDQPDRLLVIQNGHRGFFDVYRTAYENIGYQFYSGVDVYTTMQPEFLEPNSLGSSGVHGATADQLEGYSRIIYVAGNLDRNVLSSGGGSLYETTAPDITVLGDWANQAGDRWISYLGDDITHVPSQYAAGVNYLSSTMRVSGTDHLTGVNQAPCVHPQNPYFFVNFAVGPGCDGHPDFDTVAPLTPAVVGHYFQGSACTIIGTDHASVYHQQTGLYMQTHLTLPFDLPSVIDPAILKYNPTLASQLLEEIHQLFNDAPVDPIVGGPPARIHPRIAAFPNPFNPVVRLRVDLPAAQSVRIGVYDLRGQLVSEIHRGPLPSGSTALRWDGQDSRGAPAASGVYLVRVSGEDIELSEKLVLMK